jgi:hypothetical protein
MDKINKCYASPDTIRMQLIRDFQLKIEHYQNLPMEATLSPITAQDLISLMKDLLALFEAFHYS